MVDISLAIEQMKQQFNLDAIITLDYETFYGKGYSLRNKTYWQYINDPRFRITQFAYAEDDGDIECYTRTKSMRSCRTSNHAATWASVSAWSARTPSLMAVFPAGSSVFTGTSTSIPR